MSDAQIIVIGAGIAGLGAARTLHDAGLQVKLVEARRRIGGRMWTDRSLGIPLDLGGSWIHGPEGNPITPLAERFEAEMAFTDLWNRLGGKMAVLDADGTTIDPALLNESRQQVEAIFTRARQQGAIEPEITDVSLEALIRQSLAGHIGPGSLRQRLFDFSAFTRPQILEAADMSTVSWALAGDYQELAGGDQLLLRGYNLITDGLAQGLEIETETIVQEIEYDSKWVRVRTNRGQVAAERAVITLPVGVLQAGSITFAPELPLEKRQAIDRIGMGVFEKLALKFPRRFWPIDRQLFFYLGDRPGHFPAWINLAHYHQTPVLVTHHAGSPARMINQLPDETLIAEAMTVLRVMFGAAAPEPEAYVRTSWQKDPFSQGSYTFQKVGQLKDDRQTLAAPVGNRLFFAGEATQPTFFGTVHGAYSSGLRAAEEILSR
jgi:monoamine oxidase